MAVIARGQVTVVIAEKGDTGDIGESITGKMLWRDPEFRSGMNGCAVYNNAGNGTVVINRIAKPDDCPTTSSHCLQITTSGAASPGHGGYHQTIQSRANAVFISRIIAKIPVGYSMANAHNQYGTGGTTIPLTSMAGTGAYQTYLWKVVCGTSGTFSTINHYYLTSGSAPVTWYVASSTVYDMTDTEKYDDAIAEASKTITYRGIFSETTVYYNTINRKDCVKYGSNYYIYKGTNATSAAWNAANWSDFGGQFESVATGILLAELAYIENLGVKNLRTSPSGQRVEITQNNNALAFYDGVQSYPVVEIKTTSDFVYLGQGSGILIKHPASNISINNGILQNCSEGSGISVPILPWGQPETIAQNCILQSYNNSYTGKYKTGLYIDISASQSTTSGTDKFASIFANAGIFLGGSASAFRSNNVLCGVTAAGRVSATGTLLNSWVISFMGGYLTASKTATGKYRISFSNTSYLYGASDYHVFILPDAPVSGGSNGAYGCTLARTSSYFDVWMSDDASANDCAFTFIVFLISKFF